MKIRKKKELEKLNWKFCKAWKYNWTNTRINPSSSIPPPNISIQEIYLLEARVKQGVVVCKKENREPWFEPRSWAYITSILFSSKRLGSPSCIKVWPRRPRDDHHRHLASVASHQRVLSTSSFFLFFFFFYFPHSFSPTIVRRSSFHEGIPTTTRPPLVLSKFPPLLPTRGSPIFSVYLVTFFFEGIR